MLSVVEATSRSPASRCTSGASATVKGRSTRRTVSRVGRSCMAPTSLVLVPISTRRQRDVSNTALPEKRATIADLLKARSGVYHPAVAETEWMKARRPARGSHLPGAIWYYNNWDFNALGTIFEPASGTHIYTEVRSQWSVETGLYS